MTTRTIQWYDHMTIQEYMSYDHMTIQNRVTESQDIVLSRF